MYDRPEIIKFEQDNAHHELQVVGEDTGPYFVYWCGRCGTLFEGLKPKYPHGNRAPMDQESCALYSD